jgi:hypothetical protein
VIYEKRQQVRVVRTEHHLRIYEGSGTASMMKKALEKVPDGATLTEIIGSESNLTTLVFVEEQASPTGDNNA